MLRLKLGSVRYDTLLLAITTLFVVIVSVYVARKEALLNSSNADVLVYNNLFSTPFTTDDIYLQSEHTFFIKYPLFWLENWLGFSTNVHVAFSIAALLVMNIGVCWLIYLFSQRNKLVSSLLFFALASITLFSSVQGYFWGYSALTIRNIEIPLTLFVIAWLLKQEKFFSFTNFALLTLLVILNASDKLALSIILGAAVLFLILDIIWQKRDLVKLWKNRGVFYGSLLCSVVGAFALEAILKVLDILFLPKTAPLRTAESLVGVFSNIPVMLEDTLNLFGANIFGKEILALPPYILNFSILLLASYAVYKVGKVASLKHEPAITFMLMMVVSSFLVYLLLHGTAADRYLVFIPFILLITAGYYFRDKRITVTTPWRRVALAASALLLFVVLGFYSKQQRAAMAPENYNKLAPAISQTRDISADLLENDVELLAGNYWIVHPNKFTFDQNFDNGLIIIPVVVINEQKVNFLRFISRDSWMKSPLKTGKKTAYVARDVDYTSLALNKDLSVQKTFGTYAKKIDYPQEKTTLYLYDYDIRKNIDLE